ncbi:MAG: hypothetical protein FWJ73_05460 [Limnochordales bacterium]|nr:hypothetical protein [Bacillota bacterium]
MVGRSVLAYFARREQAELACSLLRQEGYDTVQLGPAPRAAEKPAGSYPDRIDGLADWSAADDASGAGEPVVELDSDAEGLSREDAGWPWGGPSWVVTVVTGEDGVNRAVQILEDAGGAV